jgi:hypothetical protein
MQRIADLPMNDVGRAHVASVLRAIVEQHRAARPDGQRPPGP